MQAMHYIEQLKLFFHFIKKDYRPVLDLLKLNINCRTLHGNHKQKQSNQLWTFSFLRFRKQRKEKDVLVYNF